MAAGEKERLDFLWAVGHTYSHLCPSISVDAMLDFKACAKSFEIEIAGGLAQRLCRKCSCLLVGDLSQVRLHRGRRKGRRHAERKSEKSKDAASAANPPDGAPLPRTPARVADAAQSRRVSLNLSQSIAQSGGATSQGRSLRHCNFVRVRCQRCSHQWAVKGKQAPKPLRLAPDASTPQMHSTPLMATPSGTPKHHAPSSLQKSAPALQNARGGSGSGRRKSKTKSLRSLLSQADSCTQRNSPLVSLDAFLSAV